MPPPPCHFNFYWACPNLSPHTPPQPPLTIWHQSRDGGVSVLDRAMVWFPWILCKAVASWWCTPKIHIVTIILMLSRWIQVCLANKVTQAISFALKRKIINICITLICVVIPTPFSGLQLTVEYYCIYILNLFRKSSYNYLLLCPPPLSFFSYND